MSNELAVIEISDDLAPTLYVENGLDKFLAQIQDQVNEVPDLTTKKGRDRIASLAAQVSRSKTAVEKPGREFLKRLKEQPKVVEAELRRFVTECDRIRDETRRPLTEWEEAETARKDALQQRLENLRALADVIDGAGNYLPSGDIQARLDEAKAVALDESWEERAAEAGVAKDGAVQQLETALTTAKKREDEAAELERLRKQQEETARREHEDTGLEAVGTYDFLRNMIAKWELPIKCIRVVYNEEHGKASNYEMLNPESLQPDMVAWKGMLKKYGTPYHPGGARCTDRMKKAPYKQYCNQKYGRGNFRTWLGIRHDEPMRLWGEIVGKSLLSACGYRLHELSDLFRQAIKKAREFSPTEIESCIPDLQLENTAGVMVRNSRNQEVLLTELIAKGMANKVRENLYYLAEVSDFTKEDINQWWQAQEFDLQLEEQLGNCLFCIKKSDIKIALAERDEPEMARLYQDMLLDPSVKIEAHREGRHLQMYRKHKEFGQVIAMFQDFDRDEIASRLKSTKQFDTGSCSQSCDAFSSDDEDETDKDSETAISANYGGSKTPPEHRDSWRTPPELFAAINAEFRFVGDVAASGSNALHQRYLTEQQDALKVEWVDYFGSGYVWCNPPYSDVTPWVEKASEECANGIGTVMLLPADTSVGWFKLAQQNCTEVRFITGGRLSFIRADTGKPGNGNNKGSMLIIMNPHYPTAGHTGYVERDTLMQIGRTLMGNREVAA